MVDGKDIVSFTTRKKVVLYRVISLLCVRVILTEGKDSLKIVVIKAKERSGNKVLTRKRKRKYLKPEVCHVAVHMITAEAAKVWNRVEYLESDPGRWYEEHRNLYCKIIGKIKDIKGQKSTRPNDYKPFCPKNRRYSK